MDGCLDVRTVLERCGVRGPNLDALAGAPGLTVAEVAGEWASLSSDRRVRSPAAVLVNRLAGKHGVTLGRSSAVPPEWKNSVAGIEKLRQYRT